MEQTILVLIASALVLMLVSGFVAMITRQNSTIRRLKSEPTPVKAVSAIRDSIEALQIQVNRALAETSGNGLQIGELNQRIRKIQNKLNSDERENKRNFAIDQISDYLQDDPEAEQPEPGYDPHSTVARTVDGDEIDYR